ncbi:protein farnesyltransferase [Lasiosphaeria miniovina]|uniref:Protein farnesyltransferase/geranylgeranyltransferase type-1 subunit alpha n=1 Tax=Lasiosphaeria miniovina TaxID=1954250 RepID=A0AA40B5M4_9PEZI|nr:protein farnesyltransferase [Lasiosphaeria miniovina]KAK0728140.1 protein farnesyltransferase [Lasiosphaeria miniovina]
MPPKGKAAPKPKGSDTTKTSSSLTAAAQPASSTAPNNTTPPATINERSQRRVDECQPYEAARQKAGLRGLSQAEQFGWVSARFARSDAAARSRLGPKSQRELWRYVNDASLPVRVLKKKLVSNPWGVDRNGRDIGSYSPAQFDDRAAKRINLTVLAAASQAFRDCRERTKKIALDDQQNPDVATDSEVQEERERRREMAKLRKELYGDKMPGKLAQDPEWDDVLPIPHEEPEGSLAAISYPDDYAEAISYLRAVMENKEYSPRCLRLTEYIIGMNSSHYTVWLFRASIVIALKLPFVDELAWLNKVALEHLKNYQIWHHRHLLVENYYPSIAGSPEAVASFAAQEQAFLSDILEQDTKNYHVWSYRSYLVGKLGLWDNAAELAAIEAMIKDDVRNNSAWSHRFYLVFSNPAHSTAGTAATEPDPAAPAAIVDREVQYAQDKIHLAPQNQSPWNYLHGVLVKGGRKLGSVEPFVADFVRHLGDDDKEDVISTHALDLLAEIYAEKGDKEKADLALRRLGEKWDRIRIGYWEWRRKCLESPAAAGGTEAGVAAAVAA